jgi:hypothetical protein
VRFPQLSVALIAQHSVIISSAQPIMSYQDPVLEFINLTRDKEIFAELDIPDVRAPERTRRREGSLVASYANKPDVRILARHNV